ncbi:MAG: polysaccharide biosynthesis protein [Thiohalomonadales bacterium]
MSKIEDALNKIKIARSKGLSVVSANETADNSNEKDLVAARANVATIVNHTSSVKQIALMNNNELLVNKELSELKVIFSDMPDKKIADTYRDLRTKLIQKSQGRNMSVMLTSCVSGYYSTMTAVNLAAAFSFDESKTSLLIDCNLNNPQLHEKLNMPEMVGLTDYLENSNISLDSILQESGIKRLRIIPAGTSREVITEYFTSLKMRDLMSTLLKRYMDRYLFIDAAPIVESADTRILVELCDYVLLVVPYGKATKSKILQAVEAIGAEKLLGIIFADKPAVPKLGMHNKNKIK